MYFIIYTRDKENSLPLRQNNRATHLAWLTSNPDINIKIAGPWLDEAQIMRGSLLIVQADAQDKVEEWLRQDPYAKAGLTQSLEVKPFNWVLGAPDS